MKYIYIAKRLLFYLFFGCVINACSKLVEIEPPVTRISDASVYENGATAITAITGIYTQMSSGLLVSFMGNPGISLVAGLSADELTLYSGSTDATLRAYYSNELIGGGNGVSTIGSEYWSPYYRFIFMCNAAIYGLTNSSGLRPAIKQQLLGEAFFMRAFFYFYLINLYGDVPLVLSTDYTVNTSLTRIPKRQVYLQVISDLIEAQNLLSETYLDATLLGQTNERIRPTKWAATALLSRVYLYTEDWAKAEAEANVIISNTAQFDTVALNSVFIKNSKESIWQLQPVRANGTTEDGRMFILNVSPNPGPTTTTTRPVYVSSSLLNSFENGDRRSVKKNWLDTVRVGGILYTYPFKYKTNGTSGNEYFMVFRLAEQYLIRAEARLQQDKLNEAIADINVIRKRAGLPNMLVNDKPFLLSAILHERQVELFTEWGHRWFDLKRTGNVDVVMSAITPLKGGGWQSTDQLYPILIDDINKNQNLEQNKGY